MVKINRYNNYFTVTSDNFDMLLIRLRELHNSLVTYTMSKKKTNRRAPPEIVTVVDKKLYIIEYEDLDIPNSKNIIRYPINIFKRVNGYLLKRGLETTIIDNKIAYSNKQSSFIFNPNITHKDYQDVYVNKVVNWESNAVLIDLQTGMGKALRNGTPVLTTVGWKSIEDITTKTFVLDENGVASKVTGVYPQNVRELLRFTFEDGRIIDCDVNHLWDVTTNNKTFKTVDSVSIMEAIVSGVNVSIPRYKPKDIEDVDLPFPIKIFGKILSKLDTTNRSIDTVLISQLCKEFTIGKITNLVLQLKRLNWFGKRVVELTYPEEFKILSPKQVKELIINIGCKIHIPNYNIQATLQKLVRSIGGTASYCDRLLEVNMVNKTIMIDSVEPIQSDFATCIAVDGYYNRFVTKDYIVTHNTIIGISSISIIKRKFSILILPRYFAKWKSDILENTDITEDEILAIQGLDALLKLLSNPEELTRYRTHIISLTTMAMFIKNYRNGTIDSKYSFTPDDVLRILESDILLIDEVHQEFYTFFKFMLYSTHRLTIALSATLLSNDPHVSYMFDSVFSDNKRISNVVPYNKYLYVIAMRFRFNNIRAIKSRGGFGYSSDLYEKSIKVNRNVKNNYFDMIFSVMSNFYLKDYRPGDKCLIFMYTVDMCRLFNEYVSSKFVNLSSTIYTEKEDYEVIGKSDIIVSTIPSSGTALDIPNLTTVVQMVNTDSIIDNVQTAGRLREIKGRTVRFIYLWSLNIPQHGKYHKNRKKLYSKRAKNIVDLSYNRPV